jgi:hypothetical protein
MKEKRTVQQTKKYHFNLVTTDIWKVTNPAEMEALKVRTL